MEILASRSGNHDETLLYYVSASGEIMLAPDNRVTPQKLGLVGWHAFSARTAKEKDDVAARMAAQLYDKKKKMKVEQRMREQAKRDGLRACARIRLAKAASALDAECNRAIIRKMDEDDDAFFRELAAEFDPTNRTSGLEIEFKEKPLDRAARGEKRQGIA
jgi:hypothetical protein